MVPMQYCTYALAFCSWRGNSSLMVLQYCPPVPVLQSTSKRMDGNRLKSWYCKFSVTRLGKFEWSWWQILLQNCPNILKQFGPFEKCHYLNLFRCGYFLDNYWGIFGYFLFLHLVTLQCCLLFEWNAQKNKCSKSISAFLSEFALFVFCRRERVWTHDYLHQWLEDVDSSHVCFILAIAQ